MAVYYPTETELNSVFSITTAFDTVYLPDSKITSKIIIPNDVIVFGQENTVIDLTGGTIQKAVEITAQNVSLSKVTIKQLDEPGYYGIYISNSSPTLNSINILGADTGICLNTCHDVDIETVNIYNCNTGIHILNSRKVDYAVSKIGNCKVGIKLEGSSAVTTPSVSYQSVGVSITDDSLPCGLEPNTDYYFKVNDVEYTFKTDNVTIWKMLTGKMNISTRVGGGAAFNADYNAFMVNGDIRIASLKDSASTINIGRGTTGKDLFNRIIGFDVPEIYSYVCDADENGSLLNKYFVFTTPANSYYIWFFYGQNYSPDPKTIIGHPLYNTSKTGIKVDVSFNDSSTVIAQCLESAINTIPDLSATVSGNNLTVTNKLNGSIVAPQFYSNQKESTSTVFTSDLNGSLDGKYFVLNSLATSYYVWYDQGSASDPGVVGKTGINVKIVLNETADVIAQKTKDAIDALDIFNTSIDGATLIMENRDYGNVWDSIDVNTGFQITVSNSVYFGYTRTQVGVTKSFGAFIAGETEADRTDRVHDNTFSGLDITTNDVGTILINANNNSFTDCKIHENKTGIWQLPSSYKNSFTGEIYSNTEMGVNNSDKAGNEHIFEASEVWWGEADGPSLNASGSGDKISRFVSVGSIRISGTEPLLSYPNTRDWIWGMLGYPQVRVELTEKQVTDSINMAIDRWMYYKTSEPVWEYLPIGATNQIILPPHITKESIMEVCYSPNSEIFSVLSGTGESSFLTFYLRRSGGTFLTDFYVAMSYKKQFEKTLGIEPSYELVTVMDSNGKWVDAIRLYPKSTFAMTFGIKYSRSLTEEEVDNVTWIRKYALTFCKEQVGRIRSKFGSVPGPTGEMSLDGSTLLSEGATEREKLEQELVSWSEPLGFSCG